MAMEIWQWILKMPEQQKGRGLVTMETVQKLQKSEQKINQICKMKTNYQMRWIEIPLETKNCKSVDNGCGTVSMATENVQKQQSRDCFDFRFLECGLFGK